MIEKIIPENNQRDEYYIIVEKINDIIHWINKQHK